MSYWIPILLCVAFAGQEKDKPPPVKDAVEKPKVELPEVATELEKMVEEDQKLRNEMIEAGKKTAGKMDMALVEKMSLVDEKNTARMKQIVAKHGWPGKTLVGQAGAANAWLLVQHADKDREFQKKCLGLMEAMPKGEVDPKNLAYLVDRVLVAEKKKQKYGTQLMQKDGKMVPQPIEDEATVDERRKAIGLGTLAEYIQKVQEVYKGSSDKNSNNRDK